MEDELRKIDLIRERTELGYQQARDLLDEAGGDVVSALILWERRGGRPAHRPMPGADVTERIRELVRQGNRTSMRVYRGDQTYLQVPVTVGLLGAILAPYLAAAGVAACLVTGCRVSFERAEPSASPRNAADGRVAEEAAGSGV
ncbi:MAG: DUF4342 domain-containing protein [Bacillota bacterium]